MSFEIEVQGGSSVRLPTAGKYCDRDIIVTAAGGDTEGAYNEGYKDAVEDVCPIFEETSNAVMCFPIRNYPLTITSEDASNTQVTRCGKNLFDRNNYTPIGVYPSSPTAFSRITDRSVVVSIKPNTTYTVTCNEPTLIRLATSVNYPASGGAISVYEYRSGSKVEPLTITTGNDDKWLLMQLLVNADATNGYTLEKCVESLQLELGSTATYYEPYNSETFAIDSGKPVEIVALEGVNSLFADNGAITVRCRLDAAAMYDYITNEIISLGADI